MVSTAKTKSKTKKEPEPRVTAVLGERPGMYEPRAGFTKRGDTRRGIANHDDLATQRLWENCLYPQDLTFQQYYNMYSRNNVAARVIETFPNYTWRVNPKVKDAGGTDSRFSKAAKKLLDKQIPWADGLKQDLKTTLKQLDVLGGIGGEALLVFGFADGLTLDKPVKYKKNTEIAYVKVLHNGQFEIKDRDEKDGSSTYGDVVHYITKEFRTSREINFVNNIQPNVIIHSSRCVHFKESSGLNYGISRIQKCYNQLLDISKVSGASAEVYWLGAFSGLSVETDPKARLTDESRERMTEQVAKYFSGLARSLLFEGTKAKLLYPAIVSPEAHFDLQITQVSIATEIPRRFLTGAEAAKLASQQDSLNWNERVNNRRETFIGPKVVSTAIQRCVDAGVLPPPRGDEIIVVWPQTQSIGLPDRSIAARDMTEAIGNYLSSGLYQIMSLEKYLFGVCGYDELEAIELAEGVDVSKYKPPVKETLSPSKKVDTKEKETKE